jgi:predicted NAD/FAD-binding protein
LIEGTHMKHRADTSGRRAIDKGTRRVVKALREATHGRVNTNDPIMERLRQCPEAFKVGDGLGRAFDSLKYAQEGSEIGDRYLPPSGTVIPPLV